MQLLIIALSVALGSAPAIPSAAPADVGPSVTMLRCLVSLLMEAQVPAQEGGVLVKIGVREGQQVSVGEVLGQIDTTQVEIDRRVSDLQLSVAQERVVNDVNRRYAEATAAVAEAECQAALAINLKSPETVPQVEVNRLELVWRKAPLSVYVTIQPDLQFPQRSEPRRAGRQTAV